MSDKRMIHQTERRKTTVVHVITKLELGGAQLNTLCTIDHLDKTRFEAHLISAEGGILVSRVSESDHWHPVPHLTRAIHPYKDLRAFYTIHRILKQIRPDIVHTHSAKGGVLGRLAARAARVPVIVHTYHGFSFSPFHSTLSRHLYRWIEKAMAPLTHHMIFVSSEDKRLARKMNLGDRRHTLIRSGFPLKHFTPSRKKTKEIYQRYNIPENHKVCGTIAPFKPQKGLKQWLDVAERVILQYPNACFLIAGDGELRSAIEGEARRRRIADNIRLPGFIEDIHHVMNVFDVGLSTALWEGLPQSIVQMRLKKIPVVASDIPGHREIIKDNRNGFLVAVHDTETFSARILKLLTEPDERKRLAEFPEDFSAWDARRMVEEQEHLYQTLLTMHGATEADGKK